MYFRWNGIWFIFISKVKLLPQQMKLSPILTGGNNSLLTHGLNCVDNVLFFLIPNVLHLSTRTIRFTQYYHFVKRFNSSWLSFLVDVTRAKSSANWNQFQGANDLQKLYLMQRILSLPMVLIKVLNSKWLKHSSCKTPLSTISNNSNIIIIIAITVMIMIIVIMVKLIIIVVIIVTILVINLIKQSIYNIWHK